MLRRNRRLCSPSKKSAMREIRSSLGRYLAILAIVALGVGFFVGLRVCRNAMVNTADTYLEDHSLFDYRLISTLGFSKTNQSLLYDVDGVASVESAIEADFLCESASGETIVLKAHSITENINTLSLVDGRMPQNDHEIVGDSRYFSQSALGSVITLSEENEEDVFETFRYREYTLVGLVNSPLYLNYERGSTTLANGSVAGFVFLLESGFSTDYDTEIYLSLQTEGGIYSQRYKDSVAAYEDDIEGIAEVLAAQRYDEVLADGKAELASARIEYEDGYQEYLDGKKDAEAQLADAYNQLMDAQIEMELGQKKLLDAERTLRDGYAEYASGKKALDAQKAELDQAKQEAYAQLDQAKAQLDEQYAQAQEALSQIENSGLLDGYNELLTQKQQALEALQEIQAQREEAQNALNALYTQLDALTTQRDSVISQRNEEIAAIQAQIDEKNAELQQAQAELEQLSPENIASQIAELETEIAGYTQQISELKQQYANAEAQYAEEIAALTEQQLAAEQALAIYLSQRDDILQQKDSEIASLESALEETQSALAATDKDSNPEEYAKLEARQAELQAELGLARTDRMEYASQEAVLTAQLESANQALQDAEQSRDHTLAGLQAQILEAETAQADAQSRLDALQNVDNSERIEELEAEIQRLTQEISALEDQKDAVQAKYADEIAAKDQEIAQLTAEISIQEIQTNALLAELAIREGVINAAIAAMDASIEAIEATGLLDGYNQLMDGMAQIEDGYAQIEQQRQQVDATFAEYEAQIAQGEEELQKARRQLNSAQNEINEGWAEIEKALAGYSDGSAEYVKGKAEAKQELADGAKALQEAQEKIEEGERALKDVAPASIYLLNRGTNTGYACFDSDSSIVQSISAVFPLFFFLVAALVCMTTMTRMVDEQRTQIGVLKALGFSRGAIIGKYLFYAGSAATLGSVIGFFGGSILFPLVIWQAYSIMYNFADIQLLFDVRLGLYSYGAALLCAVGATWFSCYRQLREEPAQLLRPASPKGGKRILLERIPLLWRRISFLRKVSIRNIVRYRKRFFMMMVGIGGCTALLVTGFGLRDSVSNVVNYQFGEITMYDMSVSFRDPMDTEAQEAFLNALSDSVESGLFVHESAADLNLEDESKSVYLTVTSTQDISAYLDMHAGKAAVSLPGTGEAVISKGIHESYGINVGDAIQLRTSDMHTISVRVSGVYDNYIYNYVIVSQDTYVDCVGSPAEYKTALICAREGTDIHRLSAKINGMSSVSNVTVNEDTRQRVNNMLSSLIYVVVMIIFCAGALAFIVLYNLTNININERIREIATIKVLGFYPSETNSYVFSENLALSFMGAVVGLGLGKLLHAFVMEQVRIDMICFDVRVLPVSYGWSLALTMVFAGIVDFCMSFRLRHISMTESMKAVE